MATRRQEVAPPKNTESQSETNNESDLRKESRESAMRREGNGTSQTNGDSGLAKSFDPQKLATGLGWFSIGLGLAELIAPRGVAKVAGLEGNNNGVIRLFGLREIASGVGIFSQQRPTESMWSRVAGDGLDLAMLGAAFASPKTKKGRLAFATASVLGVTALDLMCAQQLQKSGAENSGVRVQRTVIVNRSPEELYQFWRNFENLPRFMKHLEAVRDTGEGRSHWVAKGPADTRFEWDAKITEDIPNELIAWESLEGSDVNNAGFVMFDAAPGNRGTIVSVEFEYDPPAGLLGKGIAKLFGEEPEQQVAADLRRFKQVMETGEVVVSDATLPGTGYMEQRPAQPPTTEDVDNYRASIGEGRMQ